VSAPRLVEANPAWAERFEVEAARIAEALGELVVEIEHVGSTAVPGLAAKPTVDIAVGATTIDLPGDAVARMTALGYEDAGTESRPGERRFRKGARFPRDVLVHVVEWGGSVWQEYLRFRDALREVPELAAEYEDLKRALLQELGTWYRGEDKKEFVRRVLNKGSETVSLSSSSPEETELIAGALARALRPGDVVTVSGELGSGKTTFVRGACRALGITSSVTSPTYTVGHRYEGNPDVSHLDLYRFRGVSAAEWGDLEPYFDDAIAFVEWPEAGVGALPPERVSARLRHVDPAHRLIEISSEENSLLKGIFEGAHPRV
jgi:tRNA threonylcarbamoyladenosine biosynthesis protein TsaE